MHSTLKRVEAFVGMYGKLVRTFAAASVVGAVSTSASAADLPTPPAHVLETANTAPAPAQEVAALPAASQANPIANAAAGLESDGLHRDPRWPQLRNCIENTATPKEFETCLQSALNTDTTGLSASLRQK